MKFKQTACFVVPPYFGQNRFFVDDPKVNRDNSASAYAMAKKVFAKHGVDLVTSDLVPPERADYVLYVDVPKPLPPADQRKKSFLILGEPPAVRPETWHKPDHDAFAKCFTYDDDLVDGKRYFKLNSCRSFPADIPMDIAEKTKLLCLIVSNKFSDHPSELYSARREAIRWFEAHHPADFDLYGMGWDRLVFAGLLRPLNRIKPIGRWLAPRYPSYRGPVDSKFEVMRQYKFTLAFENTEGVRGAMMGDKMFDPMCAGSIPVYRGAPNVTDYVPPECFVDWRDFGNWPDLYKFMTAMTPTQHRKYLKNIAEFVTEVCVDGPFSDREYARVLVREVLGK